MTTESGASPPRPDAALAPEGSIGFPDGRTVDVRELDDKFWRVLSEFAYQAKRERYVVPAGERTDFASVPRPFIWFIPTYGAYTKAAILHDYLCRLAREGSFNRRDADGIFRQAMRSLGVPFIRRWVMWAAVRWGAFVTPEGRAGWLPDAWQVLLISAPVIVIVAPAALVIMLTLVVWYAAELVAWAPLLLIHRIKTARRTRAKRVNAPTLTLRL
jgi:Protein of unknown function (DUF1353)